MGDPSDNIPGVKGIGEKTAFSLIQKFGSMDAVYQNIDHPDISPSVRKKLLEDKDGAILSKTLSAIDCHVPMELNLEDFRIKEYDRPALSALFTRLNFKSFLQKLDLPPMESAVTPSEPICGNLCPMDEEAWMQSPVPDGKVTYQLRSEGDSFRLFLTCDGKKRDLD